MEETNSQTSTWRCCMGLTSCPVRIEDTKTNQVLPEEQAMEETNSQTSRRHSWFGLTSCPTTIEDRKDNQAFLRSSLWRRSTARPPPGAAG